MKKNYKAKLLGAIAALGLAVASTVGSTYAWFSMNTTVEATGMKVKATTAESLVIAKGTPVGTLSAINFNDIATTVLAPSTHDADYTTYASGLKYVSNSENIDAGTGFKSTTGEDLEFAAAVNGTVNYYKDFVAYIASSGEAMESKKLTFGFTDEVKTYVDGLLADGTNDTVKAMSVDIYLESLANPATTSTFSADTYVGTIALKEDASDTCFKNIDLIPANTATDKFVRVTYRVYLDGALEKADNQAYVYNDSIDTSEVSIGIQVSVADQA